MGQDLDGILTRAAQGDAGAWRELVEIYSRRVYGLLVRQCGDRDLAEEITQATFVKVVGHIGKYREEGKFEPWLFRIAMNKLRDEMRRRKRQAQSVDMSAGRSDEGGVWAAMESKVTGVRGPSGGSETAGGDPVENASLAEQIQQLQDAIAQLSAADQEILHLRHTAGMGFAEIATTLNQPLGTVLARGHRALAKLRKMMNPQE
ncbi:MAG: RNA polymerase sigma factor [Phycisphaeraceae bacterium]